MAGSDGLLGNKAVSAKPRREYNKSNKPRYDWGNPPSAKATPKPCMLNNSAPLLGIEQA
jgi:hypothetical protein